MSACCAALRTSRHVGARAATSSFFSLYAVVRRERVTSVSFRHQYHDKNMRLRAYPYGIALPALFCHSRKETTRGHAMPQHNALPGQTEPAHEQRARQVREFLSGSKDEGSSREAFLRTPTAKRDAQGIQGTEKPIQGSSWSSQREQLLENRVQIRANRR